MPRFVISDNLSEKVQSIICLNDELATNPDMFITSGVKWLVHEADHSPPPSAEVKNTWSCTSTLQYVFVVWGLIKQCTHLHGVIVKQREKFALPYHSYISILGTMCWQIQFIFRSLLRMMWQLLTEMSSFSAIISTLSL
jgi:hypothetical protein